MTVRPTAFALPPRGPAPTLLPSPPSLPRQCTGNFHVFFLVDMQDPSEMQEAIRLNRRMVERAIAMGGTCTGEHGVGVGKKVPPRRSVPGVGRKI